MSNNEQIERAAESIISNVNQVAGTIMGGLKTVLETAENINNEIIGETEQNSTTPNNTVSNEKEKSWGERYNDALEAQMRERSEMLNNRPLSENELNEMLTRQREIMEKIINER